MTTLFAGSEAEQFNAVTGSVAGTTSGVDTDFARAGVTGGAASDLFEHAHAYGNIAECWVHFRQSEQQHSGASTTVPWFLITNSTAVGVIRIIGITAGTSQMQYWNGSAWTNIGSAVTFSASIVGTWEVHCKIANSGGVFEAFFNGVLQWSFTGDTDLYSGSAIDKISHSRAHRNGGGAVTLSEVITTDTVDTTGQRLATLAVSGNGFNTAWTGTFADVDETTINDSDFISSNTAAQIETMTLTDLSAVAQGYDVVAVVGAARARKGASGPANLQIALRTNSTDYFSGNLALTTSFANGYYNVWSLNPDTSAAWTISEIQALEAGVKSIT